LIRQVGRKWLPLIWNSHRLPATRVNEFSTIAIADLAEDATYDVLDDQTLSHLQDATNQAETNRDRAMSMWATRLAGIVRKDKATGRGRFALNGGAFWTGFQF
jgi:hypothetical protein